MRIKSNIADRGRSIRTRPLLSSKDRAASSFDAIRLLAAFTVLFSHQFLLTGRHEPQVHGFGSLGVLALTVFFVISGYFIALSWNRQPDLLKYARKRALRIFPALVVVVSLSILLIGPVETGLPLGDYVTNPATWSYWRNAFPLAGVQFDLPGVFTTNFMTAVNLPLWSIPVELTMYLIVAIVGIAFQRASRWAYVVMAMVLAVAWWIVPGDEFGTTLQFLNLGAFFFVGATIFGFGLLERLTASTFLASMAVVSLAVTLGGPPGKLLLWVFFPIVVLGLGSLPSPLGRRVATLGDISYGVYLWAFPIQQIVISHLFGAIGFWASMALAAAGTAGLGLASWYSVEKPALRLKSRSRTRSRTPINND